MKLSAKQKKHRLSQLTIDEVSFVDIPAVQGARFIVAKRKEADMDLTDIEKRIAMQGYTGSAPGATTPAHIHEYWCYLDRDTGQMSGYASSIADHSHRITPESYLRGETEESDGHMHTLMTVKEARVLLAAGQHQQQPTDLEKVFAEIDTLKESLAKLEARSVQVLPNDEAPVTLTDGDMATLDKIIAAHGAHAG